MFVFGTKIAILRVALGDWSLESGGTLGCIKGDQTSGCCCNLVATFLCGDDLDVTKLIHD